MRHNLFVPLCLFYHSWLVTKVAQVISVRCPIVLLTDFNFSKGASELEWTYILGFRPLRLGHSKLWWFQATIQSALLQWWQPAVNQHLVQAKKQLDEARRTIRGPHVNVKMYKKTIEYENCKNKNSMFEYSIITN